MNLYLVAAYKNEEAERNAGQMKIKAWMEITRQTRQAYEEASLALSRHQAEHGC
jgi:hypothetical protein